MDITGWAAFLPLESKSVKGAMVRATVGAQENTLHMPEAPPTAVLALNFAEPAPEQFIIASSEVLPEILTIDVPKGVKKIEFTGAATSLGTLSLAMAEGAQFELGSTPSAETLEVRGRGILSHTSQNPPRHLKLVGHVAERGSPDARLEIRFIKRSELRIESITAIGSVALNGLLTIGDLSFGDDAQLWLGGQHRVERMSDLRGDIWGVGGDASLSVGLLELSEIWILNLTLIADAISGTHIGGGGIVQINNFFAGGSVWSGPAHPLAVAGAEIHLSLGEGAVATEIEGRGRLSAANGARMYADPKNGFALTGVGEIGKAEIDNVTVFELTNPLDLDQLEKASRFSPWMPSIRQARTKADAMGERPLRMEYGVGESYGEIVNEEGDPRAWSLFWSRLADVVARKSSGATTKARVRYVATRARRRSLKWGWERLLLTLYAPLGYGQRVGTPLVVYMFLSLVGAVTFASTEVVGALKIGGEPTSDFLRIVWELMSSPLAVIRIDPSPTFTSGAGEVLYSALLVVGALLLFLSFGAARRLIRDVPASDA